MVGIWIEPLKEVVQAEKATYIGLVYRAMGQTQEVGLFIVDRACWLEWASRTKWPVSMLYDSSNEPVKYSNAEMLPVPIPANTLTRILCNPLKWNANS